jgi:hypothetical protein
MFDPYWQYQIPLWVLIFLFLILLLIPMEFGFRLGTHHKSIRPNSESEARGDVTLTAMLALLGLMLAFTYAFSMSRADLRKVAIIEEVKAIGTAFLRADLLPEPGRTEVRERLFDYAKSRYVEPGTVRTRQELEKVVDRSVEIQSKIWPAVKSALRQEGDMTNPEKALLVSGINDVLDTHTSRLAVIYDRLPTAVLALLVFVGGASLGVAAYNSGLRGKFSRWRMTSFALILASLMYIILDYDMMMRGLIQVDHGSLVVLLEEMNKALQR